MRVILFLLIVLAVGKIGMQSYIRQQSAKDTIINAYRDHALAACRQYTGATDTANNPASIKLVIGKEELNVRLWQTSHRKWSARYQDPVIVIATQGTNERVVCEYDINTGTVYALRSIPNHSRSG